MYFALENAYKTGNSAVFSIFKAFGNLELVAQSHGIAGGIAYSCIHTAYTWDSQATDFEVTVGGILGYLWQLGLDRLYGGSGCDFTENRIGQLRCLAIFANSSLEGVEGIAVVERVVLIDVVNEHIVLAGILYIEVLVLVAALPDNCHGAVYLCSFANEGKSVGRI